MRSHIDLCLFTPILHVRPYQIPSDLESSLRAPTEDIGQIIDDWYRSSEAFRELEFHELYHFWQGMRLPFLYRYALLTFKDAVTAFRQLNVGIEDLNSWQCFVLGFNRLDIKASCFWMGDAQVAIGFEPAKIPDGVVFKTELSLIDLLECATSIAQWQICSKTPRSKLANVKLFQRWSKRNPAYLKPLKFVSVVLNSRELALRSTLPLICASFRTTQPLRAFVILVGILKAELRNSHSAAFFSQSEPCRWTELFDNFLGRLEYDIEDDVMHEAFQKEFFRLDLGNWVGSSAIHPTLTAIAQEWENCAQSQIGLKSVIDQPGYVVEDAFKTCWKLFRPPATIYRFQFSDGQHRVFLVQGGEKVLEVAGIDGGPGAIADLFTMWSTVRRASRTHFDPNERLCHHKRCPDFDENYCNLFPIIPEEYQSCSFRDRVSYLRSLDLYKPIEQRTNNGHTKN